MASRLGVVLAGGTGRRMGRTKGDLVVRGVSLALRAARVLEPLCGEVVVSVAPGGANPALPYLAVEDPPPGGRGPLAGIASAFAFRTGADLLVLACDYPFVGERVLRAVLESDRGDLDVVIAVDPEGREHPLVALWRRSAAQSVAGAVEAGRLTVRDVLAGLRVGRVRVGDPPGPLPGPELANWNRAMDLESAES